MILSKQRIGWMAALLFVGTVGGGVTLAGDTGPGTGAVGCGNASRGGPPGGNGNDNDPCDQCGNTDPIELSSGEFKYERMDLSLPGLLDPLVLSFQYRSQRIYNGRYGYGWFFPLEMRMHPLQGLNVMWRIPTGEHHVMARVGTTYTPPEEYNVDITQLGNGGWEVREKTGRRFVFGPEGLVEEVYDRPGNVVTVEWETDGGGALLRSPIVGAQGEVIALDYRIEKVTSTLGKAVTFSYYGPADGNKNGRLKQLADDYGRTVTYDYDNEGNLLTVTSPVTTFQDVNGMPTTRGRVTTFTYSTGFRDPRPNAPESARDHNLLTITDDRGMTQLVNYYDASDRVTKQDFNGGQSTIAYTATTAGQVTRADEVDGNGFLHRYEFDTHGNPTKVETDGINIHPGGGGFFSTNLTYNSANSVTEVRLPLGNGVDLAYDAEGINLLEVRRKTDVSAPDDPLDLVQAFTWEGQFNRLKTRTDELSNLTTYYYDYEESSLGELNGDGTTSQAMGNLIRVDHPDAILPDGSPQTGISEKYWYNGQGQLIRAIDGEGREVEFVYYSSPHPDAGLLHLVIVDPTGAPLTTEVTYDSWQLIASVKNPCGNTTTIVNSAMGEVLEVQAPLGSRAKYTYDANGNVVFSEVRNLDENGAPRSPEWITRSSEYDAWNRMISRTEDVSESGGSTTTRTTSIEYDSLSMPVRITSPEGRVQTFDYDERGLMWRWTAGLGTSEVASSEMHVDLNGRVVQLLSGNGELTTIGYDLFDRHRTVTDPEGDLVEIDWTARQQMQEIRYVDPVLGLIKQVQYTHDSLGRVTKQTEVDVSAPSTVSESWLEYDKSSRLVRSRSPRGYFTVLEYDDAGRMWRSTDDIGNVMELTLDGNGNAEVITSTEVVPGQPNEIYSTSATYDALDRLSTFKRTDRLIPSHEPTLTYSYDSRHNLVRIDDPLGRVTMREHDLLGRVTKEIEDAQGLSVETSFGWDLDDLLTSIVDDDGNSTVYQRDSRQRVQRVEYEGGAYEQYTFDDEDRILTHRGQDGTLTSFEYYLDGNLKARTSGSRREEFDWNVLGLPESAEVLVSGSSKSLVQFQYDGFARVWKEIQDVGTARATYDLGHNLETLRYPGGMLASQTYDELDRLDTVTVDGTQVADFEWAGRDRVHSRTTGSVTQSYAWDGLKRLVGIDAGTIQDLAYGFDDLDRRVWSQRLHDTGAGDVYDYDGRGRLEEVWYEATNPPSGTAGYDDHFVVNQSGADNRTSTELNGVPTNYNTPDPLHLYTSVGSTTRAYDADGALEDDGTRIFEYDPWNRLTRVTTKANGNERATYEYDAFGRRTKRVQGANTRQYAYFGPRLLTAKHSIKAQVAGDGTDGPGGPVQFRVATEIYPWRRYVYGVGLDELVAFYSKNVRYNAYQDALGSTSVLVRHSNGSVRERYSYDAFGAPVITNGAGNPSAMSFGQPTSGISNEVMFAGARWDPESAQYHARNRQYEPLTGRFSSRDPLGYVDGPNPYVYALSDPVNWMDPFGFEAQPAPKAPPRRPPPPEKSPWEDFWNNPIMNGLSSFNEHDPFLIPFGRGLTNAGVATGKFVGDTGLAVADIGLEGVSYVGRESGWYDYQPPGWSSHSQYSGQRLAQGDHWAVVGSQRAGEIAKAPVVGALQTGQDFVEGVINGDPQQASEAFGEGFAGALMGKYGNKPIRLPGGRTCPPNPILGKPRTGNANKTPDGQHGFPDIVDDFAGDAKPFKIPTKGPGGKIARESDLYQLEGSYRGRSGIFEWIVDQGNVTHRRFIPNGTITGYPNQVPGR